jgi:hypothetical protein
MDSSERKRVAVIAKYVIESFSESDWAALGQVTGKLKTISDHPRLFRSLSFNDDDYAYCVSEVLDSIFSEDSTLIPEVIDHFDIDLWYQQKDPTKYQKIFNLSSAKSADFWVEGYLKMFISHLSSNKVRMSAMKGKLANWGISAFVAHEDIQATREWRDEVEAGLETMEVLVAVVEPGFKESDWCVQEVGFALGKKIEIIPLRAGLDPFGFFGKFQGIQIKGKHPQAVSDELAQTLLKKPQHRERLLLSMAKAFSSLHTSQKIRVIALLDSWSIATDAQLKILLENSSLSDFEKKSINNLVVRVGAFQKPKKNNFDDIDDDIPF